MPENVLSILDAPDYDAHIRRAADLLQSAGLVVIPTETVYGAAGLLTSDPARQRLRSLQPDPERKPFTIHLPSPDHAARYLGEIPELGRRMIRKLWPGPVGLIFELPDDRRRDLSQTLAVPESDLFTASTITLRCPDHPVAADLLARVDQPVVLRAVGTTPGDFADAVAPSVDLILAAGGTKYSKPSTLVRVFNDHYRIVREGVYDERIIERLMRTTILFVCSGNTCRSPMAEALARQILSQKLQVPADELEKKGFSVLSAGSFAFPGSRATPEAVDAVRELGADLSRHRSRLLSVELIHQADAIFVMSRNHANAVTSLVPASTSKIATLDPAGDIEDPIGGSASLYRQLAGQMKTLIARRLEEKVPS